MRVIEIPSKSDFEKMIHDEVAKQMIERDKEINRAFQLLINQSEEIKGLRREIYILQGDKT